MRAVVFDFDGVIADSEPLHFEALRETLAGYGIAIDEEEYRSTYLAYDDREALRVAFERHARPFDLDLVEEAAAAKKRRFEALIPRVALLPGVRELVGSLRGDVALGIASGALTGEIEAILSAAGLRAAFDAIVGADQVPRGKPDPAPYLEAVARLRAHAPGLLPGECLAFEDSMAGIASARAAGLRVVGVATSFPAERLTAAHHVLPDLTGLDGAGARRIHSGS